MTPQEKERLRKYQTKLRLLARKNVSVKQKRRHLQQTGGFLPALLAPLAASVVIPIYVNCLHDLDISGSDQSGPDQTGPDQSGPVWTSVDQCGPVWTSVDQCGPVWTSVDQCGPAWTIVISGPVWTSVG